MRLLLVAAILCVAAVAAFFAMGQTMPEPRRERPTDQGCGAGIVDDGGPRRTPRAALPEPTKDPDAFIEACAAEGADLEIIRLLESGVDKRLRPRWVFGEDGPRGHPTLRSIYIDALGRIGSARAQKALRGLVAESASVEESLQAAMLLAGRRIPAGRRTR